jgi:hypothetical protein
MRRISSVFTKTNTLLFAVSLCILSYGFYTRFTVGSASFALVACAIISYFYILFFIKGSIDEIIYKKRNKERKTKKFRSETF